MSANGTDPDSAADAAAAMQDANSTADTYQAQGRGEFIQAAHASQLPGHGGHQDPGVMGAPRGKGQ